MARPSIFRGGVTRRTAPLGLGLCVGRSVDLKNARRSLPGNQGNVAGRGALLASFTPLQVKGFCEVENVAGAGRVLLRAAAEKTETSSIIGFKACAEEL